jgi:cytochrome d ubiquinol oxidase subunit I
LAAGKGTFCHEASTLVRIMEISTLLLAKVQFALSLNFHVLFAAFAMALSWALCLFKYQAYRRPDSAWTAAYRFWVRIFALAFFMALASALPILVEFGILWPALMERAGNVAGPMIACGITTLFVTKSVFFGVMLFGQRRVSPAAHLLSVCMVALGLTATVFWEVALQSWSHAPLGVELVEGRFQVLNWLSVIFNPALVWYCMLYAAGGLLTVGCLMLGLTAWQAQRHPLEESERLVYRTSLYLTCIAVLLQLLALDGGARLNARLHPVSAAAVMGYWSSEASPDMVWLGWPSTQEQSTDVLLSSEGWATRWLGVDADAKTVALDSVTEPLEQPAVKTLFWLSRLALFATLLVLALLVITARVLKQRGDQAEKYPVWLLRSQVWIVWLGAAVWLCVWNLSELSQIQYFVTGHLFQSDLVTNASASVLTAGLVASGVLYFALFAGFIQMLLHAARFGVVPVRKPGVN